MFSFQSVFAGAPVLSSETHETAFFLFNMFSIQVELCGVLPGEPVEDAVLIFMFFPEVMSSP